MLFAAPQVTFRRAFAAAAVPVLIATYFSTQRTVSNTAMSKFYDFKVNDVNHKPFDLSALKGKVVLVVNVVRPI